MDLRLFFTVFGTIFVAELADKTQLVTFLYAADARNPRLVVFLAASAALVCACAIGVGLGATVARFVDDRLLARIAGVLFVAIGVWTFFRAG